MTERVAVLVDGDNLAARHADEMLSRAARHGEVAVARVYADARRVCDWHQAAGFRLQHAGIGKNASDLLLALDAMELALTRGLRRFVIASSDGDFAHLAARLRDHGARVHGLGEAKAPPAFRASCSDFATLDAQPGAAAHCPPQPAPAAPPARPPTASPLDHQIAAMITKHGGRGLVQHPDLAPGPGASPASRATRRAGRQCRSKQRDRTHRAGREGLAILARRRHDPLARRPRQGPRHAECGHRPQPHATRRRKSPAATICPRSPTTNPGRCLMPRDPRYDILFEPVRIGPVTAPNRFYQVPHCTGMGHLRPQMLAAMRGVKAEGGWGVVCTEYNSIHPTSDDLPHVSATLWNDDDIRAQAMMTEAVHAHGALAGAELWYSGARSANHFTRLVPMDVTSLPNLAGHPYQTRAMDRADIRDLRRWHRNAAMRAREAGFDIVYVYATHGYLLANFLDPAMNTRGDEYGGNLENRVRLVRELIEDTKDAVGDRCAVAVRFKADETAGEDGQPQWGERREMFEMLAELPDLWDINIADYSLEMGTSRFTKEGALEPYMAWVKQATTKPVVTVGRFTSPDTMVSQIRRGITDLIGAARPSIADPFLPRKIEDGRIEDIRECIGCNVCYTGDSLGVPIRCTQNPTMGEEWRRGWHPERAAPRAHDSRVLIVGAGPAGLEAARTLGLRGHRVMLAEATRTLGGRVAREAALPGLSEYIRVRDYRAGQLARMPNVEVFRESPLTAEDVFEIGADHVAIATGAAWRADRFDGKTYVPVATGGARVHTPDDIMDGHLPQGPAVVFDADNYYMGSVIAEWLAAEGMEVTYVTNSDSVSAWAGNTAERWRIRTRLMKAGIRIVTAHSLTAFDGSKAELVCEYSGAVQHLPARGVVMVTQRAPRDGLYHDILAQVGGDPARLPFTLQRIGDCEAPAIIAAAVHAGHRYATELETEADRDEPLRHDRPIIGKPSPQAPARAATASGYATALLRAYEEEIEGEAWYRALARRRPQPRQQESLLLLAQVERATAEALRPLIDRHGLTPAPRERLEAEGERQAAEAPQDWGRLIASMTDTFPAYVAEFEALERMAPPADRAILARLTAHEVAALDFLRLETAGEVDSTAPLRAFLLGPAPQTAETAE